MQRLCYFLMLFLIPSIGMSEYEKLAEVLHSNKGVPVPNSKGDKYPQPVVDFAFSDKRVLVINYDVVKQSDYFSNPENDVHRFNVMSEHPLSVLLLFQYFQTASISLEHVKKEEIPTSKAMMLVLKQIYDLALKWGDLATGDQKEALAKAIFNFLYNECAAGKTSQKYLTNSFRSNKFDDTLITRLNNLFLINQHKLDVEIKARCILRDINQSKIIANAFSRLASTNHHADGFEYQKRNKPHSEYRSKDQCKDQCEDHPDIETWKQVDIINAQDEDRKYDIKIEDSEVEISDNSISLWEFLTYTCSDQLEKVPQQIKQQRLIINLRK
jgi:hypothetical protein